MLIRYGTLKRKYSYIIAISNIKSRFYSYLKRTISKLLFYYGFYIVIVRIKIHKRCVDGLGSNTGFLIIACLHREVN